MGTINARFFSFITLDVGEVTCELSQRVGNTYEALKISVGGKSSSAEYRLIAAVHDDELEADSVQFGVDFTIPETKKRFVENGLLGLRFGAGIELSGVRIVLRLADRSNGYTREHPFFALYLDWMVTASAAAGTKWSNGEATGEVQLKLPLTTGFSYVRPPQLPNVDIDIADMALRIDLDGLVVTTGWLPLTFPDLAFEVSATALSSCRC